MPYRRSVFPWDRPANRALPLDRTPVQYNPNTTSCRPEHRSMSSSVCISNGVTVSQRNAAETGHLSVATQTNPLSQTHSGYFQCILRIFIAVNQKGNAELAISPLRASSWTRAILSTASKQKRIKRQFWNIWALLPKLTTNLTRCLIFILFYELNISLRKTFWYE